MMNPFELGLLRYLTKDQLTTIQSMRIGIGGAGGLGSNTAMILVRSGFKYLEMIDQDVVDASNLNRQQYFLDEIDGIKVELTKKRLLAINPDCEITIHHRAWSTETGDQYFQNADFVIEAFDQAHFKYAFVDYYHDKAPVLISGNGMAGLLEKQPMTVKKIGNIYMVGDGQTDSACGHPPMAPRVIGCAAKMAEIVLDETLKCPS
ncbi:MAG: sulfur carrier protein ThiS adenylyltransferase ThiF [Candidatus Omnitrophica bacterium]|nr:sulfur carrier protein ThiS adenylyltransferase ThiF [Candidatus Omnitrophota bacterium]